MDFLTIRGKLPDYKNLTEFRKDFELMCENAMTYNTPDTIYYKCAEKITYFLGTLQMLAFLALHWHVLSVPYTLDGLSPHFTGRPIQSELLSSAGRWRAASLVTPSSSPPSSSSPSSSSSSSQLPRHLLPTHTFRHRQRQKLRSLQVV